MSCPIAQYCSLYCMSLAGASLTLFRFIAHTQAVFTLDSDCVKLVVEEVKYQLFEGTSKWPMAADSWGLVDPHYVL